jgi:hypothetical protein
MLNKNVFKRFAGIFRASNNVAMQKRINFQKKCEKSVTIGIVKFQFHIKKICRFSYKRIEGAVAQWKSLSVRS